MVFPSIQVFSRTDQFSSLRVRILRRLLAVFFPLRDLQPFPSFRLLAFGDVRVASRDSQRRVLAVT